MNSETSIRKKIILTRDSVAAGDDVDAPHYLTIEIGVDDKIEVILTVIMGLHYLPQIQGGKATWSVASNEPLAIIAQEWTKPLLICMHEYPHHGTKGFYNIERLHFNYHAQDDPQTVFQTLRRFKIA